MVFPFLGTRIGASDLSVSRVPVDIFISAETEYIPRPFITSLDIFFVRRRILPAVPLKLWFRLV
jgi:hypothetical protein